MLQVGYPEWIGLQDPGELQLGGPPEIGPEQPDNGATAGTTSVVPNDPGSVGFRKGLKKEGARENLRTQ